MTASHFGSDPRDSAALELRALQRVMTTGGRALELDAVLDRCLEQVLTVAGGAAGAIYLRQEPRASYERALSRGADDALWPEVIPLTALDQQAAADRVLIDLSRPGVEPPSRERARSRGFSHLLLLRLTVDRERVGVVGLLFAQPPRFTDSILHTLDAMTAFEAVSIASARTHQELRLRAHLASTLRHLGEEVLELEQGGEISLRILRAACALARGDRALLTHIYPKPPGELWAQVEAGLGKDTSLIGSELPLTDPHLAAATAGGSLVVVEDTATLDPHSSIGAVALRHQTRSFVLLTMRLRGRALGHLFVGSGEPRRYQTAELEAMQVLSSMAAQALARARRRAKERAEHDHITAILEHLPMVTAMLDRNGQVVQVNAAARAFSERLGTSGDDWGQLLAQIQILDPSGRALSPAEWPVVRALAGERVNRELTLVGRDGRRLHAIVVATPLAADDGKVELVMTSLQDVTELRELANAKDRFLSIASHELRSPLTSLRASTSLLQMDPAAVSDPARREVLLRRIQRQVDRLATLVNKLLDTTRLNAGELPLERVDCDLAAICREALEAQRLADRDHPYQQCGETTLVGHWDPARLEQVITNLLTNAGRYSPASTAIEVTVRAVGDRALVEVTDHGPGIGREQQERLFTPFFRGAAATSHKGGLGLGLYISREIVRRHGGELRLDSTPGRGCTFTVDLPRR